MLKMSRLFVTIGVIAMAPSLSYADDKQSLSIMSNGENVGYVKANTKGDTTTIQFHVDDNGRGPKSKSKLTLNQNLVPVHWTLEGTSLMGGTVDEWFHITDDTAQWKSQADDGETTLSEPALYLMNDGTPWDDYVYAKALLKDEDHKMPLLPAGELTLNHLAKRTLSHDDLEVVFDLYRLSGANSTGSLIAIDESGDFFAKLSESGSIIKEGYEAFSQDLMDIAREQSIAHASQLAKSLTNTYETGFAVANIHIYSPESGDLSKASTVFVKDNRIADIKAFSPNDIYTKAYPVFDGAGGTLMSGLTDMHSHTSLQNGLYYLAAGVTSTRDMGNQNEYLQDIIEKKKSHDVAGPRLIARGGFLEGRSTYSARYGIIADTEKEAVDAVKWYADNGYDFIKTYNSFNPDWYEAVVAEAHKHNLPIVGHVPAFTHPDRQIEAGYDEITHMNQLMLGWLLDDGEDTRTPLRLTAMARASNLDLEQPEVRSTLEKLKDNDVGIDTTGVILELLMLSRAGKVPAIATDYFSHMPISYQRNRKRSFVKLEDEGADQAYKDGFQRILDTIKRLYDNDIRLLPGTDNGTGFTMHRELELYTLAGIPAKDVLRIATLDIAKHVGKEKDLGSIEIGKLADFVLLPGNPIKDIKAIKTPRMVVVDGNVYFPDEIYKALNIIPFSTPPARLDKADQSQALKTEIQYTPLPGATQALIESGKIPFSGAVTVGDVVYFSGQIGGPNGGAEDFKDDARQVMDSISEIAKHAGVTMQDVFKCTVMLDDISNWPDFNEVYVTYFTPGKMPARSAFAADGLALNATVEVECMAKAN
ncbi:Endoribonuclease L-PSP [Hirschia baltica ATCC 49814]|uniref:Endoribonuclease L-PSP n=2 Tax=Hirschia TaxID=2723 RepID=C6XPT5_HIRBI|nr:Endoribonuclease L-PSP [Hirschia baltica ATCC 49814]